jgi:predicted nuclease of predicted toxin-antitoxin system
MAILYADEQFPYPVVELLRNLGHDVLTVQEAGKANQKISDPEGLAHATSENRTVITQNRKDFIQLHNLESDHAGIIVCTTDRDWEALASRIDIAIKSEASLKSKLIRIVRPAQ